MQRTQSPEQYAAFQQICRDNGLDPKSDVWQHKQSGQWIIGRPGIEKIQGKNNIEVSFQMEACLADFACVKATATRKVKQEGKAATTKLVVESYGSAQAKNCQLTYYAEMAEKRALSRSVLKLMGFYKLGVYGEDEADDFKRPAADSAAPPVAAATSPTESAAEQDAAAQQAAPSQQDVPAPAPASPHPKSDLPNDQIKAELNACQTLAEVKQLYKDVSPAAQEVLKAFFTEARKRLQPPPAPTTPTGAALPAITPTAGLPTHDADGEPIVYATGEQKDELIRRHNHPLITRQEKSNLLLGINKLTQAQADEKLARVRAWIDERENGSIRQQVRGKVRGLVTQYGDLLGVPEADRLRALADNEAVDANELRAELLAAEDLVRELHATAA